MLRRAIGMCVIGVVGLLSPAARADFVVHVDTLGGEWSTTEGGLLSSADGPVFGSLPPAPGVEGFRMSGSAEMLAIGESFDTTMSVAFQGDAEGTITQSSLLVGLKGAVEVLTFSPEPRTIVVRLMLDLTLVDDLTGLARDAVLDSSFSYSIDESMSFPFDHQFDFDLSDYQGLRVTGVSGLVSASSSIFSEQAGDVLKLTIPGSSLDFGLARTTAVPEPSTLLSGGLAMLLSLGYAARRRRRT